MLCVCDDEWKNDEGELLWSLSSERTDARTEKTKDIHSHNTQCILSYVYHTVASSTTVATLECAWRRRFISFLITKPENGFGRKTKLETEL